MTLDTKKVNVEFIDVTKLSPIDGRKYTVTHSDITAELFVTIGLEYAFNMVNELRDEVFLSLQRYKKMYVFLGEVLVDGEGINKNIKMRHDIFIRELPKALQAVRYADRELFNKYKFLDSVPVLIKFKSTYRQYNNIYDFGYMGKYKV